MESYALKRVSPKDLYNLPGREHYSIQWQRKLLRDIRDFVNKSNKQFVSVKDVAEFFQTSIETTYRALFPKQSEFDRNQSKQKEIDALKKGL